MSHLLGKVFPLHCARGCHELRDPTMLLFHSQKIKKSKRHSQLHNFQVPHAPFSNGLFLIPARVSYHCSSWRRSHSLQRRTGTKLHGCKWSPAKRRLATAYANDTPRVEHTQGSRTKQPKWSNQVIWQSGLMCQFWNFKASTSWSCSCFSKALGKHWDHKLHETWARAPPL